MAINCLRAAESVTSKWTAFGDITRVPGALLRNHIEFPLILGRDFSGVVQQVGHGVRNVKVGDEVFGVVGIQDSGTHTDHIVTSSSLLRKKPRNLSFVEAASIPYAGLTAWAAIRITGSYYFSDLNRRRFLVLGGSGGVGTLAVQYLKSYGAYVVTTCSSDAVPLLSGLGCDFVVDYKSEDCPLHLKAHAPFDCILDLTGPKRDSDKLHNLLKPATGQKITLSPPFLGNLDKYGLVGGLLKNLGDLALDNWKSLSSERVCTKWGFFIPSGEALQELSDSIAQDKIQPVVQEVFKFDSLPSAYQKLKEGHARGKIVIDFE
jgi:NADPH:quinone reductase-like Zn-dependent oxidoreductase